MKIILKILIAITIIKTANGQHFHNLIEKGKYSKVWKKCQRGLKKHPDDLEKLFFSSVISSKKSSGKFYSPQIAYNFYLKAYSAYNKESDQKTLSKYDKLHIYRNRFRTLSDSIYFGGLANAKEQNTEEAYISFLNYYTQADEYYKAIAKTQRNRLAFEKATRENTVESFQKFIKTYPEAYEIPEAKKLRNKAAFTDAKKINTVEAYENFIHEFPDATEISEAWKKIHSISYQNALSKNTIESLEEFIDKYPKAEEISSANERIHELAFEKAKAGKNSYEMKLFINTYPKSKQIAEAKKIYDDYLYIEETNPDNWISFKSFIEKYPKNSNIGKAKNELKKLAQQKDDPQLLGYVIKNYEYDQSLVDRHYALFTKDGELSTINKYKKNFYEFNPADIANDENNASIAEKLLLHLPYNKINYNDHLKYLQLVKDKELAFVVAQRILSPYISSKNYSVALHELDKLPLDFNNPKVVNLRAILTAKIDSKIKPTPCKEINSPGNEFSPVLSADDKTIYFCGQDRLDNLGGEDIFECNIPPPNQKPNISLNSLSTKDGNEAPVSISSDGTKMFLFQSGKLYFSEKTSYGWSEQYEIDDEINNGNWQGDAMLSSDGNHLFFSAHRSNEVYNSNDLADKTYHGDILYPTDIFICNKENDGTWSYPINLGATINTRYCERFPFLHPDLKTLYFSSDGHGGLGKLDVFMTTRMADSCWNCWTTPINLGKEINTNESDAGYKITTSGETAYFTLNKRKNQESSVLFILDISGSMTGEKIQELKKVSKSTIEDVISNNAEVSIAAFNGDCKNPITSILPFTKNYGEVENFIDNLYPGGGTPMYEAYYLASNILKTQSGKNSKNKILVLMTDGDASSCYRLNDVLNKLKKEKSLFKTQTIAYEVAENSRAYDDLLNISNFSGGEFYHASSTQDLGSAFEKANSNIFQIVSGPDNKDLYKINLPPHLRPDIVARIEGDLKNSKKLPISTTIRWEDLETRKVIGTSKSDPQDGSFFIVLPMGKNYGYFIEDTAYFPISQNLDLRTATNAVDIKKNIQVVSFNEMIDEKIAVPMNNLFFNVMKSDLLPSSIPELTRIAGIIKKKNYGVELSGHTDNVGSETLNQKLSEDRAMSVKNFLILQGINPNRITTIGYGFSKPKASNESEEGKALNRRVEIIFSK